MKAKSKLLDLEFEPESAFERVRKFARGVLAVPKKDIEKKQRKKRPLAGARS